MSSYSQNQGWQFWIDRGGTFTDVIARSPQGQLMTRKLLSENRLHYSDAAVYAIREFLKLDADEQIPDESITMVKMGTTVATNALLEQRGAETALLITRGFADALSIAYQDRPGIFALDIHKRSPLYRCVVEIDERMTASGDVEIPLDLAASQRGLQQLLDDGIEALAIVFMHAWHFPAHEQAIARMARDMGFRQISVSHEVSPLIKLVGRGDTTVIDAYLNPVLRHYVDRISAELGNTPLQFMQSSGGLCSAPAFRGKDAVLSGPAGGVVGMAQIAKAAGFSKVIGFDMGGTSTDVSHYHGEFERDFDTTVAGYRLRNPVMRIHTVAAGGGSIVHFDGLRFTVGPDSAGAVPGPAAYRNGGPLTVTDCNIMLGRLQADYFPHVFGQGAGQPLDVDTVRELFTTLCNQINQRGNQSLTAEQVAEGFLNIAVSNMANAIKKISVQRGYNVRDYVLCSFGGAGGQHACRVADTLNMTQVLIHTHAGVLSALGMGLADQSLIREQTVEAPLSEESLGNISMQLSQLAEQAELELRATVPAEQAITLHKKCYLRYRGADTALLVDYSDAYTMTRQFSRQHRQYYGFAAPDKPLVIATLQVEAVAICPHPLPTDATHPDQEMATAENTVNVIFNHASTATPVYRRDVLATGQRIEGPALIIEPNSTIVVEPGWQAYMKSASELVLRRTVPLSQPVIASTAGADPVLLEIINNLFMSIAEQMGVTLQNTASSVNIKERLDFSCALFDGQGNLIANAPHIPVHIGSMSDAIKSVIDQHGKALHAGDCYLSNSPYHGGTHLPDLTVIKPVHVSDQLIGFIAARGHHADIGGITPGSMPARSHHIAEEGVLIDNLRIVHNGRFDEQRLRECFEAGPHPARNINQNISDIQAQIAACEKGAKEITAAVQQYGCDTIIRYMAYAQDYAGQAVIKLLGRLRSGRFQYFMDDGTRICVAINIDPSSSTATIDFTGSSAQHAGNFNAPASVCKAAVMYVFRCLLDEDIPLNSGFMRPLNIVIPDKSILNPAFPAAVVAGNVETSQAIVNTLFGALGKLAASQGTCNNFTFGNELYQYYETLCGGSGAGAGFHGADAVHTHMTNSRLTDPEILELRFPITIESFAIRKHSGGNGQYRGGNGVVRRIRFNAPMTASILSDQRRQAPFGLDGGCPGKPGRNTVERINGRTEELPACAQTEMNCGDVFVIETPGGGGFGKPSGKTDGAAS